MDMTPERNDRTPRTRPGPLAGVRIADFTWVAAGPLATRFLADMGAEVIKIEDGSPGNAKIDMTRHTAIARGVEPKAAGHHLANFDINSSGMYNNYNRSKLAVTINMSEARGRDLCKRLIAKSNVVTENFAPGIMERWGLDYEQVNKLSPEIIYARMSGFGHAGGPYEMYRSFGPVVQAVCGLSHISGVPGGGMPSGWGMSYMDNQGGYIATNAVMAALYHRGETGKGSLIDLSAVEAGVGLVGPKMLDVTVNGAVTRGGDFPCANRLPDNVVAPHGVYPSRDDDSWIAIAVMDDAQWANLRAVIGADWATDSKFDKAQARHADQDLLDAKMAEWTKGFDKHQLAHRLQAAGVPAMAVQSEADKEVDPQLTERELYFKLDHPMCGEARFEGTPIKFSRTNRPLWRSAPMVGEDNAYVFKGIVGVSDDEFEDLKTQGII